MGKTRVIVAGGRDFENYELLKERLDIILADYESIEIVSGHARGADLLGEKYANEKKLPCRVFPAEWKKYPIKAGFIRNSQMLDYAGEETPLTVAFWDGESHGTKDTIKKAGAKDITVFIEKYRKDESGTCVFVEEYIVAAVDEYDYELTDYYLKHTEGKIFTPEEARKIWGLGENGIGGNGETKEK